MSVREDLQRFYAMEIDFESIGLMPPEEPVDYFCTPVGAEHIGSLGADGIHFVLLPGDERIFCVDPAMGEEGTYVLPVAEDFRQFLSFLLFCRDASPLTQIHWMSEERFRALLREDAEAGWPGSEAFFARKAQALAAVEREFALSPMDPWGPVKALQAAFSPATLPFSDEYYDVLGLDKPGQLC